MTDIPSGKVPVLEVTMTAWRFLAAHWREFLPAALLLGVVSALTGGAMASGQNIALALMALAISTIAGVMFSAAVYRRAIHGRSEGLFSLSLGPDEFRLFGVSLALALMFVPLMLLVFLIFQVVIIGRMNVSPAELEALLADPDAFEAAILQAIGPNGAAAFALLVLVTLVIAIYVAVRLFMISPATAGERRMVMFQTWSWSRGNVLQILGAICLTTIPAFLIVSILGDLVVRLTLGISPLLGFSADVIVGFLGALANIPVLALGAHLYKGLRPSDFVAK
jgi:hypothetical protein